MEKQQNSERATFASSGDDRALLEATARGQREAFERLYARYYSRLFAYLMRLVRAPDLAEEAVDDVMLVVWSDASRYQGRSSVSTWIFGIAYRTGLKALRRHRRWWKMRSPIEIADLDLAAPDSPARDLGAAEMRARLNGALARLPPQQRSVLLLTFVEGMTYQQVSEVVGCPVNTVKTRVFHARRRLRRDVPGLAESYLTG